jgi:hypothetical protein
MLQKSLATIALCLIPTLAVAAPLPRPNSVGDYAQRTSHQSWVVVDPDPNGVNCRWSKAMPENWYAPDAKYPPLTIGQWAIVKRFRRNTILTANLTPAGFATMTDTLNKPWLKVSMGENDQICLVRANSKFIRPVRQ